MQLIEEKDLFNIGYYEYGEAYFGSCGKMNYRVARDPLAHVHYMAPEKRDPAKLLATVWPGPMNFAVTEEEKKSSKEFEFSEEGLHEAVIWLQEQAEIFNADKKNYQ